MFESVAGLCAIGLATVRHRTQLEAEIQVLSFVIKKMDGQGNYPVFVMARVAVKEKQRTMLSRAQSAMIG